MDHRLYRLRYRAGRRGVIEAFLQVPASGGEVERRLAEAIGRAWCLAEPGRHYILTEPAVLADETILPTETLRGLLELPPKREVAKRTERERVT